MFKHASAPINFNAIYSTLDCTELVQWLGLTDFVVDFTRVSWPRPRPRSWPLTIWLSLALASAFCVLTNN